MTIAKKAKRAFDFIVVNPTKFVIGTTKDVVCGIVDNAESFTAEQTQAAKDVIAKKQ